jgi:hypothetical protein
MTDAWLGGFGAVSLLPTPAPGSVTSELAEPTMHPGLSATR